MAVPVGHQTTTVFGRVRQSAAPGAKSAIYDCLVMYIHLPVEVDGFSPASSGDDVVLSSGVNIGLSGTAAVDL